MSGINNAIRKLHTIREEALENRWMNRIYPFFKLFLTCYYIGMVTSVSPQDWDIQLSMGIYLLVLFIAGDLSLKECMVRLRVVLPFVGMMGMFPLFWERDVCFLIGTLPVTTGMLDFISLVIKSVESLFAVYLLVITTTVEKMCVSLRQVHCPNILVTLFLLIYRYIGLLMEETERMLQAYRLRAPGQKGIAVRAWGSFAGRLLLRTFDRAEQVSESMRLRGFQGEYLHWETVQASWSDWIYLCFFAGMIVIFRYIPVFVLVGNLIS